jgi:hypothetical protein
MIFNRLTWIDNESRLLQLRGVMDAVVVLHPESPSQQCHHRVRTARPRGGIWPLVFLSDIQEEW